ncbi:MAG: MFS transporter [Alphaproteobacteria bacterium]|nr:MFS transporter [Alphaproteobacteria bacterium]
MPSAPPRHVIVPLVVACALFMENMDSTVLATALPAIAVSLDVSPLRLNLAITSYLLSLAVFIPVSGWVADKFGTRTVFRAAIVVFTVGSVLCAFSSSLAGFVGARILQGMGGAMMVPVGRLVLLRSIPKAQLIQAMAYLTVPALIGPIIGPPLGGFITTYFSWHWIFWINVPIGILGFILVTIFIDDVREESVPPLDVRGFVVLALALVGLIFGFETVGRGLVPPAVAYSAFGIGAVCTVLYVLHARLSRHPVIKLALLRYPTFRASVTGGFFFHIGVGAIPFLLPLMLQVGFGMNPFHSGLLTFSAAVGAMTMKMTAAPILKRFGFHRVLIGNAVLSSAFIAVYGFFQPDTPAFLMLGFLLLGGFFRSLQFTSMNILAFADIPREEMSQATSFSAMAQQLSLSVGVGVAALILHIAIGGAALPNADDFLPAFLVVGGLAALSTFAFWRLPPTAGAELSGHQTVEKALPTQAQSKRADA